MRYGTFERTGKSFQRPGTRQLGGTRQTLPASPVSTCRHTGYWRATSALNGRGMAMMYCDSLSNAHQHRSTRIPGHESLHRF